ncbi:hypothetical protein [Dactylosporangium sp. CS-033363]|uniref:hypothetical protein n=1 Tax=Dactylosporangium sp. CS-033363 TaxID=3239935 RepID=UPI003D89F9FB
MARTGRAVLLGVTVLVLLAATGAAWLVGARARTPGQRALAATPPPPSVVTALVSGDPLVKDLVLDGAFARETTLRVAGPPAAAGATRVVVTALPLAAGAAIDAGTVVAELSGRPLVALPGAFPAYRDLGPGDRGPDVKQLQQALRPRYGTPVTAVYDARTGSDVRRLYRAAGYDPVTRAPAPAPSATAPPPADVVLPAAEVLFLPQLPATLDKVLARVGDPGTGPLLAVGTGGRRVVAPVDGPTETILSRLPAGAAPVLAGGACDGRAAPLAEVRDTAAPEPAPAETGAAGERPAGREAVFAVDGCAAAGSDPQQVRVVLAQSPPGAVVVPVSALWTGLDGRTMVTVADGPERRDVPVDVRLTVVGRAAVTAPAGALPAGSRVVVAYRDGRPGGG